jgi:hypothetical protein
MIFRFAVSELWDLLNEKEYSYKQVSCFLTCISFFVRKLQAKLGISCTYIREQPLYFFWGVERGV